MNKDTIYRQAAIEYIKLQKWRRFDGMTIEDAILTMIREVPSAQQEPQKWLDHNYYLECPSCKRYVTNRTPYCPYCGGRNE